MCYNLLVGVFVVFTAKLHLIVLFLNPRFVFLFSKKYPNAKSERKFTWMNSSYCMGKLRFNFWISKLISQHFFHLKIYSISINPLINLKTRKSNYIKLFMLQSMFFRFVKQIISTEFFLTYWHQIKYFFYRDG